MSDLNSARSIVLPESLDKMIVALLGDYKRRKDAILERSFSRRTEMEYRYINYRIEEGALEICPINCVESFIDEIAMHRGYANSDIDCMSEVTYKKQKQQIKFNIARKLHLID